MKQTIWTPDTFGWQYKLSLRPGNFSGQDLSPLYEYGDDHIGIFIKTWKVGQETNHNVQIRVNVTKEIHNWVEFSRIGGDLETVYADVVSQIDHEVVRASQVKKIFGISP